MQWSDAMDASTKTAYYSAFLMESNPGAFVDQIVAYVRMSVPASVPPVDWRAVRNAVREDAAAVLLAATKAVAPPALTAWKALVTYREGLLCSACEPGFSRFLHLDAAAGTLKLHPAAANEFAAHVSTTLDAVDEFLKSGENVNRILVVVEKGCVAAGHPVAGCLALAPLLGAALNLVRAELRVALCGPEANADAQTACRDMVVDAVLRGLVVDPGPVAHNVIAWLKGKCAAMPLEWLRPVCNRLDAVSKAVDDLGFSFDARPVVTNEYHADGFDVESKACSSHLSGFACGGHGPRAEDHGDVPGDVPDEDDPTDHDGGGSGGLSGGAVAAIVLVCVGLAMGGVGFVWRSRIRDAMQNAYERLHDHGVSSLRGDSSTRPLVGLV